VPGCYDVCPKLQYLPGQRSSEWDDIDLSFSHWDLKVHDGLETESVEARSTLACTHRPFLAGA